MQSQQWEENIPRIDLEQMTDAIWEEMKGQVGKQVIQQALEQVLPRYHNSRVWLFVPILLRRDALDLLHHQSPLDSNPAPA